MRGPVVAGKATQLDVALGKLFGALGGLAQFGRTHGGKVGGVHKDDAPTVAEVGVEVKGVARLRAAHEIGKFVVDGRAAHGY